MKTILILALTLFSLSSFAQNSDSKAIQVIYAEKPIDPETAFFVNGRLVSDVDFSTVGPNRVDVVKKDTLLNGHSYKTRIMITTGSGYAPSFISLNALKKKYTNLKSRPCVFMIDDRLVTGNDDKQLVDEKAILRITVNKVNNPQENLAVDVVNVSTKLGENTRNAKQFLIRGNNGAVPAGDYMDSSLFIEMKNPNTATTL